MIRSFFVSLFFFFGPALLLFMLRNLMLLLLLKAKAKQEKVAEVEVIDITPVKKDRAPTWFYALVVVISLSCATTVFMNLERGGAEVQHYVPAHTDASGNIIPGEWKSKP
ncbi:hypothetical protein D8Y20_01475 [Mariprofundus sp. EBB-1]|uniref:hypothetical protein n=1 Tax=Mariprofundus sp. EBB-1 TaxID=2650971 RepID=UPI000EF21FAE|nr:hypothetical protein [Mariprofundus sp. EBB-1]RLL55599.1 hypothetical protein D8Y20_01475 [Mariprofundus sp. EBB-1]